jgi:hypothetical protein
VACWCSWTTRPTAGGRRWPGCAAEAG